VGSIQDCDEDEKRNGDHDWRKKDGRACRVDLSHLTTVGAAI